jgi:hypothetical protein
MVGVHHKTTRRFVLLLGCLALLLGSCGDPVGGNTKSPIFLVVGGETFGLDVDVYSPGVPGNVQDDFFEFEIQSIYKNQTDPPTTTFADVLLQEYRVTYFRADGNPNVPDPLVIPFSAVVPAGGTANLNTLILRSDAKLKSPLKELAFGGGEGKIIFNAYVQFFGEDLAGNEVSTDTVIILSAADYQ